MHYSTTSVRRWLFIFLTSLKLLNRIWRNLIGRMTVYRVNGFFFGPIGKTRWPPWPLIGWDIFVSSETAERNFTMKRKKAISQYPWQVCFFGLIGKRKLAAWASLWLRHFRLRLSHRWTEFDDARTQCPLPSL